MTMEAKVVSLVRNSKYQDCLFNDSRKYIIPEYQRPYSWGEKQLEDFFEAIERSLSGEQIFMGTVQFARENDGYHIIDGQQRLTTFLLLYRLLDLLDGVEENYIKDYSRMIQVCNFSSNQKALGDVLAFDYEAFNVVGKAKKEQKEFADSKESRYMKNMRILKTMLLELFSERDIKEEKARSAFIKEIQKAIIDNVYFVELTTISIPLPQVVSIFNTINTTGLDLDCSDLFKLQYFEYLKKAYGNQEKWMSRISECYEFVNKCNISMREVLDVYKHCVVAKLDLGWEYMQKGNEAFFGEVFQNEQYKNVDILKFNEFNRIVILCCDLVKDVDNLKSTLHKEILDKDKMLAFVEKLIDETRYSRYWTLPYVFAVLRCDVNDEESVRNKKFVEALEFGLGMAKYFMVFSVAFDKVINPVHTYVCGTVLPYIAGVKNEKTRDIKEWRTEIAKRTRWNPYLAINDVNGKDKGVEWLKTKMHENVFENYKRARILCVLSALLEEVKDNQKTIADIMALLYDWKHYKYDVDHIYPRNKFRNDYPNDEQLFNSLGNLVILEAEKNRAIHDCDFSAVSNNEKENKKNKLVTYRDSNFKIVKNIASIIELNNYVWAKKDVEARRDREVEKIIEFVFN